MIKRWIIRKLLRLLEPGWLYHGIEDDRIRDWMAQQAQYKGYLDYFRKRDLTHLKALGMGLERDEYLLRVGQRLELLYFVHQVDEARKAKEKEDQKRQREAEAKAKASGQNN